MSYILQSVVGNQTNIRNILRILQPSIGSPVGRWMKRIHAIIDPEAACANVQKVTLQRGLRMIRNGRCIFLVFLLLYYGT